MARKAATKKTRRVSTSTRVTTRKKVTRTATRAPTTPTAKPVDEILHIGIDLGTARSAVAASNGERHWVDSYVGWPKDFVARKMLGKRALFGAEALENRLSLDLCRPLEQGVIRGGTSRDEESVQELIGHLIEMADPAPGQRIQAAVGVPAEALRVNKTAIKSAIGALATHLMVVSEPFAVAYGMGALNNTMVVDIGAGTVDLCIMHGSVPDDDEQRSLVTAGDYVDRQLLHLLNAKYPATSFTLESVRHYKEQYGFMGHPGKKVEVSAPVDGRMMVHEIGDELRRACESILPAIAETAVEMIARLDPEYQDRIRGNIVIAGGGSQITGIEDALADLISEYGPCSVSVVEDALFGGAVGALALAEEMPEEYWEES